MQWNMLPFNTYTGYAPSGEMGRAQRPRFATPTQPCSNIHVGDTNAEAPAAAVLLALPPPRHPNTQRVQQTKPRLKRHHCREALAFPAHCPPSNRKSSSCSDKGRDTPTRPSNRVSPPSLPGTNCRAPTPR
ncbi:hypothetical protein B5807_03785 [Epicoccum nigrum]|uniref:Uncharacterized protein n=1 Tax=Epicoccum nigrum TaxID=105696 RepID=A0A1Y2M6R1_EPING|nr:hypothetical protein B5807_03785 [Epicoccum nigrum]